MSTYLNGAESRRKTDYFRLVHTKLVSFVFIRRVVR
jgi:hypothetical protein